MGWKGTVRSIQAAGRQAQREADRRQREYERQQKQLAKMAELDRAAAEVAMFDDYVRALETIHATEVAEVEWEAIARSDEPATPTLSNDNERAAMQALDTFKPKRLESKKRQVARLQDLEQAVSAGAEEDRIGYGDALAQHARDVEEWRSSRALAEGVLAGDVNALAEASKQIEGMAGGEYLRYVELEISDESPPAARVGVSPIADIVPAEQKSLLQSGKLSVKQMPKGRYNEIYQDYVCGSSLLVANTVLGMLPVPELIVTAHTEMLNTATGHIEETPVLSMFVPRATVARLNLSLVDASDAMSNFSHNMKFMKTKGFQPVESVSPPSGE